MSIQTIARRYATALTDVVIERNETQTVREELQGWSEMIGASDELREVLNNPTIPQEQKTKLLENLVDRTKISSTTANFLRLLLQNQRLAYLKEIYQYFANNLDERGGVVAAQVTTAHPVTAETQEALRARLGELTGKQVQLSFATDEELIGGIVTRIGSTIYDGSVRTQLEQIKEKMIQA